MNTPTYPSSYPPPPTRAAPETMPPLPRASKGRVMRQGARRFFRGIKDLLRMIFTGRPIIAACLLLLLPLAGWLVYDRMAAPSSASSRPQIVTQLPEQPMVQQYIKAVQKGDVDAAWNALSANEKAQRIARNEDKTVFARILQSEQQSKMTYTAIHYVGSHQDGTTTVGAYYFYVGEVGSGKQTLPLIFAVDRNGAISEIADGLYEAVRAQMQGP